MAEDILHTSELGDLLVGLARAVVRAQDELDAHAADLTTTYMQLPDGTLALPPLAYAVKNATIDVEMAATIRNQALVCKLLDPTSVSLFGLQASAGTRVRLAIGPSAITPIKSTSSVEPNSDG